jgi:coiled-coil domain-containing protein 130
MPFAIWCTTCPQPTIIGQGVRFNAEKKKVGAYYTTPVYSFRMKHSICGGWIEIRTDPKNTAYIVVEGAKKRDTGEDKEGQEGEIRIRTQEEREELEKNAFAKLEGNVVDKTQATAETKRIDELRSLSGRDWEDPYEKSRQLRKVFRAERKVLEREGRIAEQLKDKMSLGIELVRESEDDKNRASLVDFGIRDNESTVEKLSAKPFFNTDGGKVQNANASSKAKHRKSSRKDRLAEQLAERKTVLGDEIRGNTRVATDPFLKPDRAWVGGVIPGLKRKRQGGDSPNLAQEHTNNRNEALGLAGYDSD